MSPHPEVVETDNGDKIIDFKERIKSGNDDISSQISKLDLTFHLGKLINDQLMSAILFDKEVHVKCIYYLPVWHFT